MTAERSLPVICPNCRIALVRYQRFETGDIVFCPQCGAGGDYKEVLEDKGNLAESFVTEQQIEKILHELGISPP
jgi:Zn-finger nucleic acid-binding protein